MNIELNDAEQKLAVYVAKCRYQANRELGVEDRKVGPQENYQTDLEGVGAEIAWCKATNVYPDLEIGSYGDADAISKFGVRFDVKATKYRSGHLLAVLRKKGKEPDAYALIVGEFPAYRIAGVMSSSELIQDEMIKDFGHGPTYAASQGQLRKVKQQ